MEENFKLEDLEYSNLSIKNLSDEWIKGKMNKNFEYPDEITTNNKKYLKIYKEIKKKKIEKLEERKKREKNYYYLTKKEKIELKWCKLKKYWKNKNLISPKILNFFIVRNHEFIEIVDFGLKKIFDQV